MKEWYTQLLKLGPAFGYYPDPRKTDLVIDPTDQSEAQEIFHGTGVTIVHGLSFLGGFIGDSEDTLEYVKRKVYSWVHCVEKLAEVAIIISTTGSLNALVKLLPCEWSYLQRIIPNCVRVFSPLNDAIKKFWPAIFLSSISDTEMNLFSLPTKYGGLCV